MNSEHYEISEDEIKEIEKDIQKSGLPLEIEVSSILKEYKWKLTIHDHYIDEQERKSREIDVSAFKRFDINSPDYDMFHISLIIECKKSIKKPWLFYTSEIGKRIMWAPFIIKSFGKPRVHKNLLSQERWMKESHYFYPQFRKKAVISYEPFTKGKREKIFEASMQVIKATVCTLKENERGIKVIPEKSPLFLTYPIIVFDGHLFEYISGKVKPVKYLQYLIMRKFITIKGKITNDTFISDTFIIDLIRKDFFPDYLKILDKEFINIKNKLITWTN